MRGRRSILKVASVIIAATIGASAVVHASPPPPSPGQATAEWTITDGYLVKQIGSRRKHRASRVPVLLSRLAS
ncbi:hypothetical protein M4D79_05935 [Mycolicibacterium novocastrense]|nr:hypothetical protein M4D79_05935 [Mycolicibacterium novocastrense]